MSICLYEITVNSNVVEFLCKKSGAPNDCFFFVASNFLFLQDGYKCLDDYSTHVQFSYLIYYFPIDYLRFNFSHFTFQVRLFSVEKKETLKLWGLKNTMERGIRKNSRVLNTFNGIYNFGKIILKPFVISETDLSCPRLTDQIQIL